MGRSQQVLMREGSIAAFEALRVRRITPALTDSLGNSIEPNIFRITSQEHEGKVFFHRTVQVGTVWYLELRNEADEPLTDVQYIVGKHHTVNDLTAEDAALTASTDQGAFAPTIDIGLKKAPTFVVASADSNDTYKDASAIAYLHENGVNDGLAAAIAAAIAAGGGRVYVRRGTYNTTAGFALSVSNIEIIGEGADTHIVFTSANMINTPFSLTGANCSLRHLTMTVPAAPTAITEGLLVTATDCILEDVTVIHAGAAGTLADVVRISSAATYCKAKDMIIQSATVKGMEFSSQGGTLENCQMIIDGDITTGTEFLELGAVSGKISNVSVTDTANHTAAGTLTAVVLVDGAGNVISDLVVSEGFVRPVNVSGGQNFFKRVSIANDGTPTSGTEMFRFTSAASGCEVVGCTMALTGPGVGTYTHALVSYGDYNHFKQISFSNNLPSILLEDAVGNSVRDSYLVKTGESTGYVLKIEGGTKNFIENNFILGTFAFAADYAVHIHGSESVAESMDDVVFKDNRVINTTAGGCIWIKTADVNGVDIRKLRVVDNHFQAVTGRPIFMEMGGNNGVVLNSFFARNTIVPGVNTLPCVNIPAGFVYNMFLDNDLQMGQYTCTGFAVDAENTSIKGNNIVGSGGDTTYGVNIGATVAADSCKVIGNTIILSGAGTTADATRPTCIRGTTASRLGVICGNILMAEGANTLGVHLVSAFTDMAITGNIILASGASTAVADSCGVYLPSATSFHITVTGNTITLSAAANARGVAANAATTGIVSGNSINLVGGATGLAVTAMIFQTAAADPFNYIA